MLNHRYILRPWSCTIFAQYSHTVSFHTNLVYMVALILQVSCEIPQSSRLHKTWGHYNDVIMSAIASQITSLTLVYPIVNDQRKNQSSASLAFVWGIHRWPVNSPHKGPVTRKMFPFDGVIMDEPDIEEEEWERETYTLLLKSSCFAVDVSYVLLPATCIITYAFHNTDPLWGESTGHRWIPLTKYQ